MIREYEHAAARPGVSKTGANIITLLIFLAQGIQEAILPMGTSGSEDRLREVARKPA